jgi:hypothetical protein
MRKNSLSEYLKKKYKERNCVTSWNNKPLKEMVVLFFFRLHNHHWIFFHSAPLVKTAWHGIKDVHGKRLGQVYCGAVNWTIARPTAANNSALHPAARHKILKKLLLFTCCLSFNSDNTQQTKNGYRHGRHGSFEENFNDQQLPNRIVNCT